MLQKMIMILLLFVAALAVIFGPKLLRFLKNYHHMKSLSSQIPGDDGLPFIGHMLENLDSSMFVQRLIDLCNSTKDRAKVLKVWLLTEVMFVPTSGEMLKHLVDSNEEIVKSSEYDNLKAWLGEGLVTSTGDKWRARRKMLTPMFYFKMLDSYMETMNRQARVCVDLLERKNGQEVDMYRTAKLCALDIICETAMGIELEAQMNPAQKFIEAVEKIMLIDVQITFAPHLWVGFIRKLMGVEAEFQNAVDTAHEFTQNVIKERAAAIAKGEETNKRSFLDMLLTERERENLSEQDMREEVDTFMFAGHDTTSSTFGSTLWCLACHPDIQAKVHAEIDKTFGDDPDRDCTKDDFNNLSYLDRCIKEAQRLYSPIPMVNRKLQNDFQLGEYLLPRGASVGIAPCIVHHNESIYPNPSKYDPDRFLPENVAKRHAYDFIPFSAGPRNCIGQKFALSELRIVLSWLLRRFRFVTDRPMDSQKFSVEATLRPINGIRLTVMKR